MKHLPSLAIALVAALVSLPALADATAAAQDQPAAASTPAEQPRVRELDVLVVTGATQDGERWAKDADAVPEISDAEWVPEQAAPAD